MLRGLEAQARLAQLENRRIEFDRLQEGLRISGGEKPVKSGATQADHQHALRFGLEEQCGVQRTGVVHHQFQWIAQVHRRFERLGAARTGAQLDDSPAFFHRQVVVERIEAFDVIALRRGQYRGG